MLDCSLLALQSSTNTLRNDMEQRIRTRLYLRAVKIDSYIFYIEWLFNQFEFIYRFTKQRYRLQAKICEISHIMLFKVIAYIMWSRAKERLLGHFAKLPSEWNEIEDLLGLHRSKMKVS